MGKAPVRGRGVKEFSIAKWVLQLAVGVVSVTAQPSWCNPEPQEAPLTPELLQIYGDYFEWVLNVRHQRRQLEASGEPTRTFFSNRTFPLDLSRDARYSGGCLQGIQFESTAESRRVHLLSPEVLRRHSEIRLVDLQKGLAILRKEEAEGVLHTYPHGELGFAENPGITAVSGVAFDKSHHFAVFKYKHFQSGFQEGSYCSDEVVVVLVKVGTRWTETAARGCEGTG